MPATCHRVVGILDVDAHPELMLQLRAPLRPHALHPFAPGPGIFEPTASGEIKPTGRVVTPAVVSAEIEQLAADLKIEYERYQRQLAAC